MKRRELFAALGALFVAPVVAREVAPNITAKKPVKRLVGDIPSIRDVFGRQFEAKHVQYIKSGVIRQEDIDRIKELNLETGELTGRITFRSNALIPLADLANHPDHAKLIFEQIASSDYTYKSVQHVDFDEPKIIISGSSAGFGDAKVVITQSTIRYTVVRRNGQEHTSDVKTEKVVEFIRGLGYDIEGL